MSETAENILENQIETAGESSEAISPELQDQAARASWNFSLDKINENISDYEPEAKQLLVDCFMFCINKNISRNDFAQSVGASANMIGKLYNGRYNHPTTGAKMGPSNRLIKAMKAFLIKEESRIILGNIKFTETPTAKRIFLACDMARESRTPVMLSGRSQIGKTWALTEYAKRNSHTRTNYIRMKAAGGLGGMLERIAEGIDISTKGNKKVLVARIKEALAPNQVLIFDEMHLLRYTYHKQAFFACLEVIREIYDEIQCGIVLCGTDLFKEAVSKEKNGELEQLDRRGVHKFALPPFPTVGDVKAILEDNGMFMPSKDFSVKIPGKKGAITVKPYDTLQQLSRSQGLKAITERIRYARKISGGVEINWESFVQGHLTIAAENQENLNDWE